MKYAVTTYIYDDLTADFSLRPALDDEITHTESRAYYDLYIDIFDDYDGARTFFDSCVREEIFPCQKRSGGKPTSYKKYHVLNGIPKV